ncbi:hypothetical protein [Methanosarcina lacustris]|nr:hypothetical protein [Methanosarcina lacustris]
MPSRADTHSFEDQATIHLRLHHILRTCGNKLAALSQNPEADSSWSVQVR